MVDGVTVKQLVRTLSEHALFLRRLTYIINIYMYIKREPVSVGLYMYDSFDGFRC